MESFYPERNTTQHISPQNLWWICDVVVIRHNPPCFDTTLFLNSGFSCKQYFAHVFPLQCLKITWAKWGIDVWITMWTRMDYYILSLNVSLNWTRTTFCKNFLQGIDHNGVSHCGISLSCWLKFENRPSPLLNFGTAKIGSAVRNDKEVHGNMILGTECKISQYADDTTMILDGSQSSFSRTLYLFDAFDSMSGLKVKLR